jgi:precorrin isomerase
MTAMDYLRDPAEIYRRSFATVRAEAPLDDLPPAIAEIALRVVHACGMPDIVADLLYHPDAGTAAQRALADGAPILVDCRMVAVGIIATRLPARNDVICTLNEEAVSGFAERDGTTRSAAAVDLWKPHLGGAVVAIGNAPTALFRLLELLDEGAPKPAVIFGFPVGFVGAAESKEALACHGAGVPFVTLRGRES